MTRREEVERFVVIFAILSYLFSPKRLFMKFSGMVYFCQEKPKIFFSSGDVTSRFEILTIFWFSESHFVFQQ